MFYNSAIKSQVLDPVSDRKNFQSEFRLNERDTIYLSNMRLANLGVISDDPENTNTYNKLTGAYGIIKKLTLYDDNTVLSTINDFGRHVAFMNKMDSNDKQMSVNFKLNQSNLGYVLDGSDYNPNETLQLMLIHQDGDTISDDEATTGKAWLSLYDTFDFLKQSPYLPTQVYKNLRLVIEYDSKKSSFALGKLPNYTTTSPILMVDSLVESAATNKIAMEYMKQTPLTWSDVEVDRVVVPSLSPTLLEPTSTQKLSFNINSFNNKFVEKINVSVIPTVEATYSDGDFFRSYSNMGSLSMLGQAQNLIINGNQKYTEDINTPAKRAALVVDAYPNYHLPLGNDFHRELNQQGLIEEKRDVMNTADYFCSKVGARISELVHTFQRVSQHNDDDDIQSNGLFNQQLYLHIEGTVRKQLLFVKDGTYRILYA